MIIIDNTSKDPLYIQIYKQIREGIITKQLAEGDKLPSTRQLSKTLQVSRNTVDAAYLQLSSEGYIKSKKCSGFIIEKFDSDLLVNFKSHSAPENTINQEKIEARTDDCLYDFQYGKMSPTDFPVKLWRKLTNQSLNTAIE
ncbi:MAG: GntR family transcriptional regulator, partial [Clostridia bacterium]|nr:GntR family transcriptional regulator [Clostridia bacterium]